MIVSRPCFIFGQTVALRKEYGSEPRLSAAHLPNSMRETRDRKTAATRRWNGFYAPHCPSSTALLPQTAFTKNNRSAKNAISSKPPPIHIDTLSLPETDLSANSLSTNTYRCRRRLLFEHSSSIKRFRRTPERVRRNSVTPPAITSRTTRRGFRG